VVAGITGCYTASSWVTWTLLPSAWASLNHKLLRFCRCHFARVEVSLDRRRTVHPVKRPVPSAAKEEPRTSGSCGSNQICWFVPSATQRNS
jgi:hypothetical protein